MPKDRAADRHTTPARVFRPPEDLWIEAKELVGNERSTLMTALLAWYVRGTPLGEYWTNKRRVPSE